MVHSLLILLESRNHKGNSVHLGNRYLGRLGPCALLVVGMWLLLLSLRDLEEPDVHG